jgi:hypothetical protein
MVSGLDSVVVVWLTQLSLSLSREKERKKDRERERGYERTWINLFKGKQSRNENVLILVEAHRNRESLRRRVRLLSKQIMIEDVRRTTPISSLSLLGSTPFFFFFFYFFFLIYIYITKPKKH